MPSSYGPAKAPPDAFAKAMITPPTRIDFRIDLPRHRLRVLPVQTCPRQGKLEGELGLDGPLKFATKSMIRKSGYRFSEKIMLK